MAESDFNELLHAAEQLSAEVEGTGELPKVERTLRQVLEASTELWSRVAQTGAEDIQAHLLLGSKGVDLPQLSQKLETLSARKTFEPLEPIADGDVQSFLKNEMENAILSVIEETHKTCFEDVERLQWRHIESEWQQEKQKSLNALLGSAEDYFNLGNRLESSVINDSVSSTVKSLLDNQEMAYGKQIQEYNSVVIQGTVRPSLVDKLLQVANTFNDQKVSELWQMVRYMSEIPPQASGDPLASRATGPIQNILVRQGKKYLEDRYKTYMTTMVMSNLQQAKRGGVPGTFSLVRSYVGIRIPLGVVGLEDGLVEEQPVWPFIYYCLRCGDVTAAIQCAKQAGLPLEEFVNLLEKIVSLPGGKWTTDLENSVKYSYRRQVKSATDPFKRAVYCVIGCCDVVDEHTEVVKTADDYLWLKLSLIRDETHLEPRVRDRLSYLHLQSLILEEYGESHYNAQDHPHVYFQMLFLTGQFEAALEFLARVEKLRVHAVHIALALHEHNLLAVCQNIHTPLLSVDSADKIPARRLNLARLIMLYVRKFEVTDPKEALQYYYFLRHFKGPSDENLFMSCISDLVLESRKFDLVLGHLEHDGCRVPGLIDWFHGVQADTKLITELVAADSENKGFFEDSIRMHDLSGNHEKVLSLMSTLMSQVVTHPIQPGSLRSRLREYATSISNRYMGQQLSCTADTASTFYTLRDLLTFFDLYHTKDQLKALELITKSKLIPMSMEEVDERVNNFRQLGSDLCRIIPDILLATMDILYSQYKKLRGTGDHTLSGRFGDSSRDKHLLYIREKARAITSFAGTVPYRMPGDTTSRLVQLEILMH